MTVFRKRITGLKDVFGGDSRLNGVSRAGLSRASFEMTIWLSGDLPVVPSSFEGTLTVEMTEMARHF